MSNSQHLFTNLQVYFGADVLIDREIWNAMLLKNTKTWDSWFIRRAALLFWPREVIKHRCTDGVRVGRDDPLKKIYEPNLRKALNGKLTFPNKTNSKSQNCFMIGFNHFHEFKYRSFLSGNN